MVPHYVYRKLRMPSPRGVIIVNGKAERSLRAKEYTASLTVEAMSGIFLLNLESMAKLLDTVKGV